METCPGGEQDSLEPELIHGCFTSGWMGCDQISPPFSGMETCPKGKQDPPGPELINGYFTSGWDVIKHYLTSPQHLRDENLPCRGAGFTQSQGNLGMFHINQTSPPFSGMEICPAGEQDSPDPKLIHGYFTSGWMGYNHTSPHFPQHLRDGARTWRGAGFT